MRANAELIVKAPELLQANRELVEALRVIDGLEIEVDQNGHAFKRIPCRSIFDLGSQLQELLTKYKDL